MRTGLALCCLMATCCFVPRIAAQPVLKCGTEFTMHQSLTSVGRNITCTARFDVVRETPTNIAVYPSDSLPGAGLLIEQTIDNLHRIAFAHDTFGLRLVFQYEVDPNVNTRYTRTIGTDTILIVTPKLPLRLRECGTEARAYDRDTKTLTLYGTLFTLEAINESSNILVERTFDGEIGNTTIVENNMPRFEEDLRHAAHFFTLERFRGAVGDLPEEQFKGLRLLVRFKVVRQFAGQPRRYETH